MSEMKVKDLKQNSRVDYLTLKITSLGEAMPLSKGVVQGGRAQDETGTVNIAFFGKDAGRFGPGDIIIIKNGWCKMFRDNLEVQAGKFGKIELFDREETTDDAPDDSEDTSMFKDTHEEKKLKEKLKEFGVDEI